MGRAPCCEKIGMKQGRWSEEEDELLANYIKAHGEGSWRSLPKKAGLLRCGKSCRLRWINYLRAGLKRGSFSREEDELIIKLHATLGNRWSQIAREIPGRTDNEIKNYWNTHLSRRIEPGSHHVSRSRNSAKMTQPTKKIRKKKMIVEEVVNKETSLKHCNETIQSEFSSPSDAVLLNSDDDALSRPFSPLVFDDNSEYWRLKPIKSPAEYSCTTVEPSTCKEEKINGPSSPDLNSILKEIDNLLNSEIEETNVSHGSHNNMPGDTDTQNGSILMPKDADGLFGDLGCLDFLWDQDLWSSLGSEDEPLQHIIV